MLSNWGIYQEQEAIMMGQQMAGDEMVVVQAQTPVRMLFLSNDDREVPMGNP